MYKLLVYKFGQKFYVVVVDRQEKFITDLEIVKYEFYLESEESASKIGGLWCPMAQVFALIKYYEEKGYMEEQSALKNALETFFKGLS